MPGSVFDLRGGRLGYGGGFYDRFLQTAAPQALRIGLAYDLQVVAAVPLQRHDQQLDYLVTETRTIRVDRVSV
jgi:5-formyltetrahydrofolate cyclo-ligase